MQQQKPMPKASRLSDVDAVGIKVIPTVEYVAVVGAGRVAANMGAVAAAEATVTKAGAKPKISRIE